MKKYSLTNSLIMTAGLALVLAAQDASAFSSYVSRIPNGAVNSCINCHGPGGPPLNAFGDAFLSANFSWTTALAKADPDRDGFTSGQELGDPNGTWRPGGALPIPGAQVTLPGDSGSRPVLRPPAVSITSPANGASFPAPYTGPITATTPNPAAAITAVQFFAGARLLGTATAPPYSQPVDLVAGGYSLTARAIDYLGASNTSVAVSITVNSAVVAPAITRQPASQTVTAGASVTSSVVATGTAPLSYQWRKGTASIPGATLASYTVPSAATTDAGNYSVVVTNVAGSVTSATATLTVNPGVVAPAITQQPASQTVTAGASVTFTVVATGTAPLSYQWRKGTANIPGATLASYTIPSAATTDAGNYSVVVTNVAGSVTSATARLTVNPGVVAPAITQQPASQTVTGGASVTFTVVVTGTAPLSYQWRKGTANIPGATLASYTIPSAATTDAGNYSVVVTNVAGSVTSARARLTVNPPSLAITLTSPTNGTTYVEPADIMLDATVSPDGSATAVEFFAGTNLLTVLTSPPFAVILSNVSAGDYVFTARATDRQGATALSESAVVRVLTAGTNLPPMVRMVHPDDGARFSAQAKIVLVAEAADLDGTVRKVKFFAGTQLLGIGQLAPREDDDEHDGEDADEHDGETGEPDDDHRGNLYYFVWENVPVGQYVITAKAVDNAGASRKSAPISITVRRRR